MIFDRFFFFVLLFIFFLFVYKIYVLSKYIKIQKNIVFLLIQWNNELQVEIF